jgi:hypothetical protein
MPGERPVQPPVNGFIAASAFPEGATFFPRFADFTGFLLLLFVAVNLSHLSRIDFPAN